MVAEGAAGEFERDVGCAFALHPGRAEVGADMGAGDGLPHPSEQDVDVVAAVAEELAAAERLFAVHPAARLALGMLLGPDRKLEEVAVGLGLEQALHFDDDRVKAHAVGDHQGTVGALGGLDQVKAFGIRVGQRFLHQQMFAAAQQVDADGMVEMVGHGEDGGVEVVEDLAIVGGDSAAVHQVGGGLGARQVGVDRGGEEGATLQFLEGGAVGLAHAAAADQADADHGCSRQVSVVREQPRATGLPLDSGTRDALDEVFLADEEHDDDRQNADDGAGLN